MSAKSIIAGDGLYYKYVADGKTTLYRWDLNDKIKKKVLILENSTYIWAEDSMKLETESS